MKKYKNVREYIDGLVPGRREIITKLRSVIIKSLPDGYEETVQYNMISYVVPLSLYPQGYLEDKKTPLPYICLASQKNHISLYLMNIYGNPELDGWFREVYKKSGKKLDMGKSCLRFKRFEDLAIDVIEKAVAKTSVKKFIDSYTKSRK